jgi:uncharacterized integral membrane protein
VIARRDWLALHALSERAIFVVEANDSSWTASSGGVFLYILIFIFIFWDRNIPLAAEAYFDDRKQIMLAILFLAIMSVLEGRTMWARIGL